MFKHRFLFMLVLFVSLAALSACATQSSTGKSSPLVHGFGSSQAQEQHPQSEMASVIKVKPEVLAIYDGKTEKLKEGMSIPTSAFLRSDAKGSATLKFNNGATLNVSPNSEIALANVAPAAANAEQKEGFVQSLSRKLGGSLGKSQAQRATPQATMGVRGFK